MASLLLASLLGASAFGLSWVALDALAQARARQLALGSAPGLSRLGALQGALLLWGRRFEAKLPLSWSAGLKQLRLQAGLAAPGMEWPRAWVLALALWLLAGLSLSLFTAVLGLGLGLGYPWLALRDLARRRRARLAADLADAADLLTACLEAGLGFEPALGRLSEGFRPGPLRDELMGLMGRLRLGESRREALAEFERRCAAPEVSQACAAIQQADRRGAPLGPALRAFSSQYRSLRASRAREEAAKAPLKMLLPLMAFILPVVFIMIFGPVILRFKDGGF